MLDLSFPLSPRLPGLWGAAETGGRTSVHLAGISAELQKGFGRVRGKFALLVQREKRPPPAMQVAAASPAHGSPGKRYKVAVVEALAGVAAVMAREARGCRLSGAGSEGAPGDGGITLEELESLPDEEEEEVAAESPGTEQDRLLGFWQSVGRGHCVDVPPGESRREEPGTPFPGDAFWEGAAAEYPAQLRERFDVSSTG